MEIQFTPEIQARLDQISSQTGRPQAELVRDALPGYLDEIEQTREMLNRRYDDLKSGRVTPIDGEEAFGGLRAKGEALRKSRA